MTGYLILLILSKFLRVITIKITMLNQIAMIDTRQMPSAIDAENAIIGALLIDSNAYKEIESIIKSDENAKISTFSIFDNTVLYNNIIQYDFFHRSSSQSGSRSPNHRSQKKKKISHRSRSRSRYLSR